MRCGVAPNLTGTVLTTVKEDQKALTAAIGEPRDRMLVGAASPRTFSHGASHEDAYSA